MKTCEDCAFCIPDEVLENKGVCEITEMVCDFRNCSCKRFVEKE